MPLVSKRNSAFGLFLCKEQDEANAPLGQYTTCVVYIFFKKMYANKGGKIEKSRYIEFYIDGCR